MSSASDLSLQSLALCAASAFIGAAVALKLRPSAAVNTAIRRLKPSPRSCAIVEHNGVVHLSGQVGVIDTTTGKLAGDTKQQTRETLAKIDTLLAEAGTNKHNVLSAMIWVRDIKTDFAPMNEVWNEWVADEADRRGVRACVEAHMARETIRVEIKITAALP